MPTSSEIQTCINNLTTSSEPINFTLLAAEASNANVGISVTVATVNDLPDLETTNIGPGQIVFVESIGVPVVSTENEWQGLDGRLLRRDYDVRSLFLWGSNSCGVLGDGTTTCKTTPTREICNATDWCQVASGELHTLAVKTTGQLWSWGSNFCGRFGDGTTVNSCSPVREICSATDWCRVSSAYRTSIAIKTTGQLWGWGANGSNTIGDGTATLRCSPVREICSATDWCDVSNAAGATHAIKTSGQIWVWGSGILGLLGDGTTTSKCSPVREFCSATDWCGVSSGGTSAGGIKTTGQIWMWGCNNCGQLGDGTVGNAASKCSPVREFCSATDWCGLSVGRISTSALKTSGELWTWGSNGDGRLGNGTTVTSCSPVREFCSATDWCQVSAGNAHTAAIKTSGQLWSWGYNGGRLGDGTATARCSPVREFFSLNTWCAIAQGSFRSTSAAIKIN